MRCRILYLVGRLHTGGLERQLYYLLRTIDRDRYTPAIAVWNYYEQDVHIAHIRKLGIPIYSLSTTVKRTRKLKAFRQLVSKLNPEVVHSYTFYTNFAAYWGGHGTRAVTLGSVRSDFAWAKDELGLCLGSLSGRWPSTQICNSSSAAEMIRRSRNPFVPKRFYVVRNGVDLERFKNRPLPINGQVSIAAIGYLLPAKRWDRLIRVVSQLKRRGVNCQVKIAGDGPLDECLRQQAEELDVTNEVRFLGHTDEIPSLLADSNFLVHTADNEGCPNAILEAMASGRAVVAMDTGDVRALVDDGKTGFVIRQGDCATLLERILELIYNPSLCQRMGQAGRAKAEQEFSLNGLVENTLHAYRAAGWNDSWNGEQPFL